jgi:Na+:H+ antiporter, NhaA family
MRTQVLASQSPRVGAARTGHFAFKAIRFVLDRFLLVPIGAAVALIWANVDGEGYFRFAHAIAFPVNEIGMAFFLGLATQESYEAVMPGGALHTWRRWTLPAVAAAGGMAGAALMYLGYVYGYQEEQLWVGWPIACAVDLAAGYYVLKLIYRRSNDIIAFFLLLGIVTDGVGVAIMAGWPALTAAHVWGAMFVAAGVGSAAFLRRARVLALLPYMAWSGTMAWFGFYIAGVHPALALVPIVPFLPHAPRGLDLFADRPDDGPVHQAEHPWSEGVQVVVFLFALANAGVLLREPYTGTWAVLTAALVGRPLGILTAVALAHAAGLRVPRGITWRHLVVIALAASSGFTLALFFATGLLPPGGIVQEIKYGALLTVVALPVTFAAAWLLGVGRFTARQAGNHGSVPTEGR